MRAREFITELDTSDDSKQSSDARAAADSVINRARVSSAASTQQTRAPATPTAPTSTNKNTQIEPKNLSSTGRDRGRFKTLYDDNQFLVIQPLNAASARYWGIDSNWPFKDLKDDSEFKKYVQDHGIFWILKLRSVWGAPGKYLLDRKLRVLRDAKGRRLSFSTTLDKYKDLFSFLKNSTGESEVSFNKVSNDKVARSNMLIQEGILYLAEKCIPSPLQNRYDAWITSLAKQYNCYEQGMIDYHELYKNSSALLEIKKDRVANFWYVVNTLTEYTATDIREAGKMYVRKTQSQNLSLRVIDEIYAMLIKNQLDQNDFDLAHQVKELITFEKVNASGVASDTTMLPDHVLGTVDNYLVYVRKHNHSTEIKY